MLPDHGSLFSGYLRTTSRDELDEFSSSRLNLRLRIQDHSHGVSSRCCPRGALPEIGAAGRTAPLPILVLEGLSLCGPISVQMICTRVGGGLPRMS